MLAPFSRSHRRRFPRPIAWLLLGWLALLPATGMADQPAASEVSTDLVPAHFDDSLSDDWVLTSTQARLLTAFGVIAGMIALAGLAAWCVTWLADRSPSGGPAPLLGGGDFDDGNGRS